MQMVSAPAALWAYAMEVELSFPKCARYHEEGVEIHVPAPPLGQSLEPQKHPVSVALKQVLLPVAFLWVHVEVPSVVRRLDLVVDLLEALPRPASLVFRPSVVETQRWERRGQATPN